MLLHMTDYQMTVHAVYGRCLGVLTLRTSCLRYEIQCSSAVAVEFDGEL